MPAIHKYLFATRHTPGAAHALRTRRHLPRGSLVLTADTIVLFLLLRAIHSRRVGLWRIEGPLIHSLPTISAFHVGFQSFASLSPAATNTCSKFWMISVMCSNPSEMRIKSGVTPPLIFSSSEICWCVVRQG